VIAPLAHQQKLARFIARDRGSLHPNFDTPLSAIRDQSGQDEDIWLAFVRLEGGGVPVRRERFVMVVAFGFAAKGILRPKRQRGYAGQPGHECQDRGTTRDAKIHAAKAV
jgi:hypothetical protein